MKRVGIRGAKALLETGSCSAGRVRSASEAEDFFKDIFLMVLEKPQIQEDGSFGTRMRGVGICLRCGVKP